MSDDDYESQRAHAAHEWQRKQRSMAEEIMKQQALFAKMPDVLLAPKPGEVRDFGVGCPDCGNTTLENRLWNTINGIRHRFEARCPHCGHVGTYDWAEQVWLAPDEFAALRDVLRVQPGGNGHGEL